MIAAAITAIEYYLPDRVLTNSQLAQIFPEFPAQKIFDKTGVAERHIAGATEYTSDLAVKAVQRLFAKFSLKPEQVDFLLCCTQTPDYLLPTTACLIQARLGLRSSVGALDINLGCSGYVYGLSLAKALIESGQAKNVLLVTADTYTKLLDPTDKSVRTIFGDGAAATWLSAVETAKPLISSIVYGTDGAGAHNLRGMKQFADATADPYLRMNGPEIFRFVLETVPVLIDQVLVNEQLQLADIDLFVFHQANAYMLTRLIKKLDLPEDKCLIAMDFCGNTVSSTIPIALREAQQRGALAHLQRVMLVGFGVGYSWAASVVDCSYLEA